MEKRVYIIIVNYNGNNDTLSCLKSLNQIDYSNYMIVVVDNNSTQTNDLNNYIKDYENIELIKLEDNIGFSAANNIGIEYAIKENAEYIMLLNNDTEVKADFLKIMVENTGSNTISCPNIYFFSSPSEIWYTYGQIDFTKCIVKNGKGNKRTTFASGCCMLIPCEVIKKIGMLSEEYFMYYEDVDYSIKAIRNNIDIKCIEKAKIYHKVGRSSGGNKSLLSVYYNNRNRFHLIKKFNLGKKAFIYSFFTRLLRYIHGLFFRTNDRIILRAYSDFRKNNLGKRNLL